MKIIVSVPGKIIISGEHAVVYGKPAIAAAVNRRLTVTLQKRDDGKKIIRTDVKDKTLINAAIKILTDRYLNLSKTGWELAVKSDIPVGAGMGSSAALAVGVITAFVMVKAGGSRIDYKKINDLAYEVEKIQHGMPSGIDNSVVTFGGLAWYRKELEFLKVLKKVSFGAVKKINNFWVINTGEPEENTKEMVEQVRFKIQDSGFKNKNVLYEIEKITKKIVLGVRGEDERLLISSISENERLLEELEVVGEFAKKIVREVEKAGGAGKISGAGGVKDKSGIMLVYHKDKKQVEKIAKKYKLDWFPAKLGVEGVKVEEFNI